MSADSAQPGTEAWMRECVDVALDIAEDLLMDAPNAESGNLEFDMNHRTVSSYAILRIVQELNAALSGPSEPEQ